MKKIIIANWKMNLSLKESLALAKIFVRQLKGLKNEVVVCPDYLSLPLVAKILRASALELGAQDAAISAYGPYSGEVSPRELKKLGVRYVILGHSERRQHFHENSAIINRKIKAALQAGLTPILCVGEKLPERKSGQTEAFLGEELRRALKGVRLELGTNFLIAYEPVWAINNHHGAKPLSFSDTEATQKFLAQRARAHLRRPIKIIYGGSVNAKNAAGFLSRPDVSGLLVGSASLKADQFKKICQL